MKDSRTIELTEWHGDTVTLTKADFMKRWRDEATNANVIYLDLNSAWMAEIDAWRSRVEEKAGEEFERKYASEQAERGDS